MRRRALFGSVASLVVLNVLLFVVGWYIMPVVRLEATPAIVDAGSVTQAPFNVSFKVVNSGNRLVQVGDPLTSCSCTATQPFKKSLRPGEAADFVAEIRAGKSDLNSQIRIPYQFGDSEHFLLLKVSGSVTPHLSIVPESGKLGFSNQSTQDFVISSHYAPEIEIKKVVTSHASIVVESVKRAPGGGWLLVAGGSAEATASIQAGHSIGCWG